MRYGIVVDSCCDLPGSVFAENRIMIMPIRIRIDGAEFDDDRSAETVAKFFDEKLGTRSHNAETEPFTVEQITELFLSRLVIDYDCVFCHTITASRSLIHANAKQASLAILNRYHPIRKAAGVSGPFVMRLIDSGTLFSGQGIGVLELIRMIGENATTGEIRERVQYIDHHTYAFMIPRDLYYLRARAQKKGDNSVGWVSATLGSALDIKPILQGSRGETKPVGKARGFDQGIAKLCAYAQDRVRAGLLTPNLCVSYGGNLDDLDAMPGYAALRQTCAENAVTVFESPMSITGMVNVGVGCISIAFASPEHKLPF
ncbi:MAG: DegV family protein [Rudaea sp.]